MYLYFLYLYMVQSTLLKNKIKFSSYIRKFRRERLQIHIWTTASSNITKYLFISSYLQPPPSEFPHIWGKFNFLFYQCRHTMRTTYFYVYCNVNTPGRLCLNTFILSRIFTNYRRNCHTHQWKTISRHNRNFILCVCWTVYSITYCQWCRLQKLDHLKVLFLGNKTNE